MSNSWFRLYNEVLNDPKVQCLSGDMFKKMFIDAVNGEKNEFSKYLKNGSDRPSQAVWAKLRSYIFKRDNFTCSYCGLRGAKLECDHIVPVSAGGTNDSKNLTTSCFRCNRSKGAKFLNDWRVA